MLLHDVSSGSDKNFSGFWTFKISSDLKSQGKDAGTAQFALQWQRGMEQSHTVDTLAICNMETIVKRQQMKEAGRSGWI